jgi:acyl-CoA thioester hydrolase
MAEPAPQVIDIRVRYSETDKMGVVYHANYFMWFEIGRCELLRTVGRSYKEMEAAGIGLPVIEAHCKYTTPARYDDELQVITSGRLLSRARVEFSYEILRPSDGAVNAVGTTMHAAINADGRPCRLPNYILDLLK